MQKPWLSLMQHGQKNPVPLLAKMKEQGPAYISG